MPDFQSSSAAGVAGWPTRTHNPTHDQQDTCSQQRLPDERASSRSPRRCSLPSIFTRGLCSLKCMQSSGYKPLAHKLHALKCLNKKRDQCRLFSSGDRCVSMGLLCWLVPPRNALITCYRSSMGNISGSKAFQHGAEGQPWQ